jgi:hypothetical protein
MLAWLFGLNEEKARSLKWLFLVGIFDILSGLIRLFSEMTHGSDDPARHSLRRFSALLSAGFHPEQAAAMLAAGATPAAIPPAQVLRPGDELPALDTGGRVLADGSAVLHKGEVVLNEVATAALDRLYPGLADALNAGKPLNEVVKTFPLNDTKPLNVPVKTSPLNDYGQGQCKHCGSVFDRLTWNHAYCQESCRIAAWEHRTGAKVKKGKKP